MLKIGAANISRRTLAGLCLIAAPLVGLIGALLTPRFTGGFGDELAAISEYPERWLISTFLTLLSFFLLIPAVLGIVHLLREGAVVLGHIGAGLVLLSLYFHAAVIGYSLVEVPLTASGIERARTIAFTEQMYDKRRFHDGSTSVPELLLRFDHPCGSFVAGASGTAMDRVRDRLGVANGIFRPRGVESGTHVLAPARRSRLGRTEGAPDGGRGVGAS